MVGEIRGSEDTVLFGLGDDGEHEGLCTLEVILEENDAPLLTRRNLCQEEAIADFLDEVLKAKLDLGESGTSSKEEY